MTNTLWYTVPVPAARTFDIFVEEYGTTPLRIAFAEGAVNAVARMEQLAAQRPGRYFIQDAVSHQVIVRIDTTKPRSGAA